MNELFYYCGLVLLLLAFTGCYFWLADRFNIIDNPNTRSSHVIPTIRGGGIIFPVAGWLWFGTFCCNLPWFIAGLSVVAVVSFVDDINPQSALLRFYVHALAIGLLFYQASFFSWPGWLVGLAFIISVGALSAFNFMDGINGMAGVYALVNTVTFYWVQENVFAFTDRIVVVTFIIAIVIFLLFNFRKRARCFAGDVGSVTIAFVQIFLLIMLIKSTESLIWVLIFLVYGIDAIVTILYRLKRRENIFKPHRTHLYQYLANEGGNDHRIVSAGYGIVQAVLNSIVVWGFSNDNVTLPITVAVVLVVVYLFVRSFMTKRLVG